MAKISSLPGISCLFYCRGKCLYDEHLNPGYDAKYRCLVLAALEREYDDFIERADLFGLEEEVARSIYAKRKEGDMTTGSCPRRSSDQMSTTIEACPCFHDFVCILAFPDCKGICARFSSRHKP